MQQRWGALLTVLALSAVLSSTVSTQGSTSGSRPRSGGSLGQNYPNPFNPETSVPFTVGLTGDSGACDDPSRKYVVSVSVFDILTRPVAIPILVGGGANAGKPAQHLTLTCGKYTAFWDGYFRNTRTKVASGIYKITLEVDGKMVGLISAFVSK
jgi:hypothetical protein